MSSSPQPLIIKGINWIGLTTLIRKEVGRFLNVYLQTVIAPVMTTLLFYMVFSLAFGGAGRGIDGIPYMTFLMPGLVMMGMAQNAFANSSSSLIIAKAQGSIVDILMPPLSSAELLTGFVTGSVLRGVIVGTVSVTILVPFADLPIHNPLIILAFAVLGSGMLALMGVMGGIWADKFDHIAAVTNFVVMPLTMLSGTFYALDRLPETFQTIAHVNPFFYMIDGFRYGFIGRSDMDASTGLIVLSAVCAFLWWGCHRMLKTGYKIRS